MEINPLHKDYRDTLAAKLKYERKQADPEKARRILDEQRSTEFYADAKKDHQDHEQKPKRLESIVANVESLQARIEALQELEQKILGAENISKNETPAVTEEEKADKQASQEGFDTEQEKITKEEESLLAEKDLLEKDLAETSPRPSPELQEKKTTITSTHENEHGAKEVYFDGSSGSDFTQKEVNSTSEKAASQEKYGEWSDADLLEAFRDNKEKLGIVAHLKPELLSNAVADLEEALRKRGLIKDQEGVPEQTSLEQEVNDVLGSTAAKRPEASPAEHQESPKKLLTWLAIAASAQKSLDGMQGKNVPWATPSMIAREKWKLNEAQKAQVEGKAYEQHEDLPTIAGALARAQEKNEKLIAAQPERSNWLKRNWRKVVAGGALLGLFAFGANTCETKTSDPVKKDTIELPKHNDNEDHRLVIEEKEDMFEEVSGLIEAGDGGTQVAKKAFAPYPELAKSVDLDVTSPESLKAFAERIKIIDIDTGNEIRMDASAIGGKIDFRVYDSGKIVAFFKYDKNNSEAASATRSDDEATKFEKQSLKEYLSTADGKIINEGQVTDDGQTADPFNVFKK